MTTQEVLSLSNNFMPRYRAFALNLTRDEQQAADLLQEAIYLVLKNHERFVQGTNLQAWIKTIIRNLFISDYRKAKRRQEITAEEVPATNWAFRAVEDNAALATLGAQEILEHVEALPEIYRRAFRLYYNGMKYKDIASLTGVPLGTAKSRVWTARNMLRERIEKDRGARG